MAEVDPRKNSFGLFFSLPSEIFLLLGNHVPIIIEVAMREKPQGVQ